MKKQLLMLLALTAIANSHAMAPKQKASELKAPSVTKKYTFDAYKKGLQAQGLKIGDTFSITNVDPHAADTKEIQRSSTLTDATGRVWAQKIFSEFPHGKTGTLYFKVTATPPVAGLRPAAITTAAVPAKPATPTVKTPAEKPGAKTPASVAKPAPAAPATPPRAVVQTKQEVLNVMKEITKAINNNDIKTAKAFIHTLPSVETLAKLNVLNEPENQELTQALDSHPDLIIEYAMAQIEAESSPEQLQEILLGVAKAKDDPKAYTILEWLLTKKGMKDTTGEALYNAIKGLNYKAAELLVKHNATITDEARKQAARTKKYDGDDRFEKLLQGK